MAAWPLAQGSISLDFGFQKLKLYCTWGLWCYVELPPDWGAAPPFFQPPLHTSSLPAPKTQSPLGSSKDRKRKGLPSAYGMLGFLDDPLPIE